MHDPVELVEFVNYNRFEVKLVIKVLMYVQNRSHSVFKKDDSLSAQNYIPILVAFRKCFEVFLTRFANCVEQVSFI